MLEWVTRLGDEAFTFLKHESLIYKEWETGATALHCVAKLCEDGQDRWKRIIDDIHWALDGEYHLINAHTGDGRKFKGYSALSLACTGHDGGGQGVKLYVYDCLNIVHVSTRFPRFRPPASP